VIPLTLAEIATVTGGRLVDGADPAAVVTGSVEHDSRLVHRGGLFVALVGDRADGHDFAAGAIADGAVAVLLTRSVGVPAVLVTDPLDALGRLARAVVDRLPGLTVIGLTGSSGKTSTKDLMAQVVSGLGPTIAPAGSLNNELGLPYTVLKADVSSRYLVLEKSARGIGHIAYLCRIAPPRIGVVLNVGVAHAGEFGSLEATAQAKGELVEALPAAPAGGVAVLNADDPRVRAMAGRTSARVVLAGEAADAEVRATDVSLDSTGRASYRLTWPAGFVEVRLGLVGRHHVGNSLAVAAVALELGMAPDALVAALAAARPISARRMDVLERPDGITLIDDSYNANPDSVTAALHALRALAGAGGRRSWAVLGYMAELGSAEQVEHERMGRLAASLGVDHVVAVGAGAEPVHVGASAGPGPSVRPGASVGPGTVAGGSPGGAWGGESVHVPDQAAAIALLRGALRPGDVVLVKGSRYRTWEIADALRDAPASPLAPEAGA
jgi:UDP-N-acetylmuramoyl-tripeptide--D-alanyl-D-alanine ligase